MKLTRKVAEARYEMFLEAKEHLDHSVTDDPIEQQKIAFVQRHLERQVEKWSIKAGTLPEQ